MPPSRILLLTDDTAAADVWAYALGKAEIETVILDNLEEAIAWRAEDTCDLNADFRRTPAGTCWRVRIRLADGTILTSPSFKIIS